MESDDTGDDDLVDDEELCAFVARHGFLEDEDGDPADEDGGEEDGEAADEAVLQSLRSVCEKIEGKKRLEVESSGVEQQPIQGLDEQQETQGVEQQETQVLDYNSQLLQHSLDKNKQCQEHLRNLLLRVEERKKENAEIQRRVKTLMGFEKHCNRRAFDRGCVARFVASLATLSYSTSRLKKHRVVAGPEKNKDVDNFRELKNSVKCSKSWSPKESEALHSTVKMQVQQHLLVQAMEAVVLDLKTGVSLEEREKEIDNISDAEVRNLIDVVDWEIVSRGSLPARTAKECKARWINFEDKLINHGPWSKAEDLQLLSIAKEFGFAQWESVAEKLGTYRTPAQCLIRYQRSLNANLSLREWSREDDEQLKLAVDMCGEKDWQNVAACLEGRTGQQAMHRWKEVLRGKKRGRWSLEEDKRLKCAVMVCGPHQWKSVAAHVPGRSETQCRERWRNVLDPKLSFDMWSPEEDEKLEEAVEKFGMHKWSSVAEVMSPRTDNQCWRRWMALHPESKESFHREVVLKKTLLPRFSKRKKERPGLEVSDILLVESGDTVLQLPPGSDDPGQDVEASSFELDEELEEDLESPGKPGVERCRRNSMVDVTSEKDFGGGGCKKRARTRAGRVEDSQAKRPRQRKPRGRKTVDVDLEDESQDGREMRAARLEKIRGKRKDGEDLEINEVTETIGRQSKKICSR
ncbi:myb-like protein L isoform X1 [Selaginella moellendorffii]|nr:myb-like protein L isoform X1 [Selaginella moellendorffii]|eukprot:XP_002967686.2 myb-like protein L isoform X1 [Selaginella moellendorffii]